MISVLGDATDTLTSTFDSRIQGIEKILTERGDVLIAEFQTRAEALNAGAERLNSALEHRVRSINESLVERTREIADTFILGKRNITSIIEAGKESITGELSDLVSSTTIMLDSRASDFARKLEESRGQFSIALEADLGKLYDERASIDRAVSGHIQAFEDGRARLTQEALDDARVVHVLGQQELHRDLAVQDLVRGAHHDAHAAGAEDLVHLVLAREDVTDRNTGLAQVVMGVGSSRQWFGHRSCRGAGDAAGSSVHGAISTRLADGGVQFKGTSGSFPSLGSDSNRVRGHVLGSTGILGKRLVQPSPGGGQRSLVRHLGLAEAKGAQARQVRNHQRDQVGACRDAQRRAARSSPRGA